MKFYLQEISLILSLLIGCLIYQQPVVAQSGEDPYVYGQVTDVYGQPLAGVSIRDANSPHRTISDANGNYTMRVMEGLTAVIQFRMTGYRNEDRSARLRQGDVREINVQLESLNKDQAPSNQLPTVDITTRQVVRASNVAKIDPRLVEVMPSVSGGLTPLLRAFGVQSNNELSSAYSVRGGSFDENLVYVNDFEVFRPFLLRSGQQEGLSFINPDMVSSVSFSAGGFEAKYGDKMSSVLDVKYKKPQATHGSFAASLLGVSAHIEGAAWRDTFDVARLTYIFGVRQRSNRYLFNSLPTKGQYAPSATDVQGFVTLQLHKHWQLQLIGNFSENDFRFEPVESETSFGTFNTSLKLRVGFVGKERDRYRTAMGGTALVYTSPYDRLTLKLMGSYYQTAEQEAFDIVGSYYIGEVDKNFSSGSFGDIANVLGVGAYQDWARNRLHAKIINVGHRGYLNLFKRQLVSWGVNWQQERINDQLDEWYRLDSAGYNIPLAAASNQIVFRENLNAQAEIHSNRYTAFVQDEWNIGAKKNLSIIAGARLNYWDLNRELVISPRLQIAYRPRLPIAADSTKAVQNDLVLRLTAGAYHQPAFFREMRSPQGVVNTDLKAQKSYHLTGGIDYTFNMFNRPFKLSTELYYKRMYDLVSYDLDNMLLRYSGQNNAEGYAGGIDLRLFGQFVAGVDSWVSLSILRSRENLRGDSYQQAFNAEGRPITLADTSTIGDPIAYYQAVEVGSVPRPTDQTVNFSLFFQDYLPNNKNFKMHLLMTVGTGFPFGPPGSARYRNAFRIPPYRRVDIGFSALLLDPHKRDLPAKSIWRAFDSIWASVEVFNLLGVQNTVSYTWVKAISRDVGQEVYYAVPNYLTARLLNAKVLVKF